MQIFEIPKKDRDSLFCAAGLVTGVLSRHERCGWLLDKRPVRLGKLLVRVLERDGIPTQSQQFKAYPRQGRDGLSLMLITLRTPDRHTPVERDLFTVQGMVTRVGRSSATVKILYQRKGGVKYFSLTLTGEQIPQSIAGTITQFTCALEGDRFVVEDFEVIRRLPPQRKEKKCGDPVKTYRKVPLSVP
jgi:hypothetical protein